MSSNSSTDRSSSVASSAHSVYSSDASAATSPATSSAQHTPKKKSYAFADQKITPPREKKGEGRGPHTPSSTASTGTREGISRRVQHDPLLPATPKKTPIAISASVAGAGAGVCSTGRSLGGGLSSLAASTISGNERDEGGSRSGSRSHSASRKRRQSREDSGIASQRSGEKRSGSGAKKDGPPTTNPRAKSERSLSRGVVVGKEKIDDGKTVCISASNFAKATETSKRRQQSAMGPPLPLTNNTTATTTQKRVNSSTAATGMNSSVAAAASRRANSNKRAIGSSDIVADENVAPSTSISMKRRGASRVKETAVVMTSGPSAERSQSGRKQTDESRRPIVRTERIGRPTITGIPTRRTVSSSVKESEQRQEERSNKTQAAAAVRNVSDSEHQYHDTYAHCTPSKRVPTSPQRGGGYLPATVGTSSFALVAEDPNRNGETQAQLLASSRAAAAVPPFSQMYAHSMAHHQIQHLQQMRVANLAAEGRTHNGPISSSPRRRPLSSSGLGRLEGAAEGSTSTLTGVSGLLSHAKVTAIKKKITVLERKAAEKTTQEGTLAAKVAHLEAECEGVLGEISALRSDEHELLLRVIEARLLHDALAAQHAETTRATRAARTRLRSEHGNATVRSFTYSHLKSIAQQKSEEVAELESARESVEAQIAAIEAEAYLLEEEMKRRAREAGEARDRVEQQGARLGAIVDSVSQALAFA